MKRLGIALLFLLFGAWLFLFLTGPRAVSLRDAPRYSALQAQPAGHFIVEEYQWGDNMPIRNGKFWTWVLSTNLPRTSRYYLYDLNRGAFVAELTNGAAIFANADETRLLCQGFDPPQYSMKQRLANLLVRMSHGRLKLPTNRVESFWVLDLRNHTAARIGELEQVSGSGSRWVPAPGFRFGFNRPSASNWGQEFYLCDLEQNTLQHVKFTGDLQGWWDDHTLVFKDADGNYVLFDVVSRTSRPFFTKDDVEKLLGTQNITGYPADFATLFHWNGTEYEMLLSANRKNGLDMSDTFLLKVMGDGPNFKLLYRKFNLHWLGYLDENDTHYLYAGESGKPGVGGNGGVYLRDLSNDSERILVPPDNRGQYALARMAGSNVVYIQNRQIWRMNINSTNSSRLFQDAVGQPAN